MAQPCLPDDIISTNILPRLSIKSVTRFRSVCKSWNSLILEPGFAKDHLYFTTQNPQDDTLIFNKLVLDYNKFGCMTGAHYGDIAVLSSSDLSETKLLDVTSAELHMLGSINGLVCLFLDKQDQFIVWNPAIRQAMKFGSPRKQFSLRDMKIKFYGFCWDAVENDFKVVVSYYKLGNLDSLSIYSCKLGSWSSPFNSLFTEVWSDGHRLPCAIVSGVPYWTYSWYSRGTVKLFKFDVVSKDFKKVPELYLFDENKFIVVNLKECLSALVYDYAQSISSLVDVHCFDEGLGVWSKMYSVGPINGDLFCRGWSNMHNVRVITGELLGCFKHGGEIVFSANSKYRCYDHKTDETRDLHKPKGDTEQCFSYIASLFFLEGMKPQHQVEPTLWK
ncbi:F-box/kelch-repeat protein At3g23880 [Daucus carota subsp. sativus]|uniref:F-box/kelch-repeat protein At3g23880 n=1 Tax=Daucus carota subsp. sativus TaxID=79200 RepID=UPI0030838993